jgi:hypothetical protein
MKRTALPLVLGALLLAPWAGTAAATSPAFDALTAKEAAGGLRGALSKGIDVAVSQLGAPNGFLNDPKVTIPLPEPLQKAERALTLIGMGGEAEELRQTMNHAAENAVSQARPVFTQALRHMTLADAKSILTGGDDAGTQYFRRTTSSQLTAKFKPVVAAQTAKLGLARKYNEYAGKAAQVGLLSSEAANLDDYVTSHALDGLFSRMADEERAIRKDPLGQANDLVKKVFGAL